MKIKAIKCPNCGAKLKRTNIANQYSCDYCRYSFIMEKTTEEIDSQREREIMRHNERIKKEDHSHEEKITEFVESANEMSSLLGMVKYVCILLIVMVVIYMIHSGYKKHDEHISKLEEIETQVETDMSNGDYESALRNAKKLVLDDDLSDDEVEKWNSIRERYIDELAKKVNEKHINDDNYAYIPQSMESFKKITGEKAKAKLEESGFINIEMHTVSGDAGWFSDKNLVERIIIDGDSVFSERELYRKDSKILIYYYEE